MRNSQNYKKHNKPRCRLKFNLRMQYYHCSKLGHIKESPKNNYFMLPLGVIFLLIICEDYSYVRMKMMQQFKL